MYRRIIKTAAMTMALTMIMTIPAFAGWQSNATGWWWQNPDNTYPANKWEWLDGNGDGTAECYYFDANGYMLTNTKTPDGSQVDANGAWTANGVVQTKTVATGGTGADKELTYQSDANSEYVVKRVSNSTARSVEGGRIFGVNDVSNLDMSTKKALGDYIKSRNYKPDFELFCPDSVEYPSCGVVQVELDGNTVISATPVWIDSLEWRYGGFGHNDEYISGRAEWRGYEESDPDYGLELQIQLTAEAKERAFEVYPDMIVDYYLDPYEQK